MAAQKEAEEREAAERARREEQARLEEEDRARQQRTNESRRSEAEERKRHANGDGNQASKQQKTDQMFAVGERVRHDQHGIGKVVTVNDRITIQYKSGKPRSYDHMGAQQKLKRVDPSEDEPAGDPSDEPLSRRMKGV